MTAVPDDVAGAELLEAQLFAHTRSPEQTAEYLHCLAVSVATARAEYAEASGRYWATREPGAAEDALRAADEWRTLTERIGAALDDLRSTARSVAARERRDADALIIALPREGWGE